MKNFLWLQLGFLISYLSYLYGVKTNSILYEQQPLLSPMYGSELFSNNIYGGQQTFPSTFVPQPQPMPFTPLPQQMPFYSSSQPFMWGTQPMPYSYGSKHFS